MDASKTHVSLATARLLRAISGDSILFRFPSDFGTPEILQLAMRCASVSAGAVIGYSSPAASHIAAALVEGMRGEQAHVDCLGLVTLPSALRLRGSNSILAYVACPLDDARLVSVSFFDSCGVALGNTELQNLVDDSLYAQTRSAPIQAFRLPKCGEARRTSILVESPSHAVRNEVLRSLPGCIELATRETSLSADPASAMCRAGSDWGAWIDAEGTSIQLFDRAGRSLDSEWVLEALALQCGTRGSRIILEREASMALAGRLKRAGFRVARSPSSRREMALAMQKGSATLGGGPSGRIWFGEKVPIADAALALNLLAAGGFCYLPAAEAATPALSGLAA